MTSFDNTDPQLDNAIALSLEEQILATALNESNEIADRKQIECLHKNDCRHWYLTSNWPKKALQLNESNEVIVHAGEEDGNCVIYGICNSLGLPSPNCETVASMRSEIADENDRCVQDAKNIIFINIIDRIPDTKNPLLLSELEICRKLIEDTRNGIFLAGPHYQAISNINHRPVIVHLITMTAGNTNFNVLPQQFDPSILNNDLTPMLFVIYATQYLAPHVEAVTAKTKAAHSIEQPLQQDLAISTQLDIDALVNYETRECKVCQSKPFTTLGHLKEHMKTQKHEKNVAHFIGENTATEYRCEVCKDHKLFYVLLKYGRKKLMSPINYEAI